MEENNLFANDFDAQYGAEYRKGVGHCDPTRVENRFDEAEKGPVDLLTQAHASGKDDDAKALAEQMKPKPSEDRLKVFGHSLQDYVNTMYAETPASRHNASLKLCYDYLILLDGDAELTREALMKVEWVQEIVTERGMGEIQRIVDAAQKRLHKRESESFNDPLPSKEMRKAIELVTGAKYSVLLREERSRLMGRSAAMQEDILHTLIRIGRELEKLAPHYELLRLLFFRLQRKYYPAVFFVGGAFAMTLLTRCWYQFWPKPGKHNRLNSLMLLIGRLGGLKSTAVDLYDIMMEPVKKSDAAQIAALNEFNSEREQNNGGAKNKKPRPRGIYRALPPETSTAALREAEANAHETIDGEEWYLHVSIFDSELQNTISQMKKGYFDALLTYWLKSFHSEKHGAYLKTSSAPIGETDVHFNAVYSGTDDALRKINTESNNVNGLMSRFTIVPNADSNKEMMVVYDYDDEAKQRDADLRDWAYKLDSCKGEIPCREVSDALKNWTARRMADVKEDDSMAEEDLIKRPCWHAINYALPFIVSRHWDQMVEDNGRWKCGPDFKVDKTDVKLAVVIANAQLAFQEYYCKAILEKHYDNMAAERASNVHHQKKTMLAYLRLPGILTGEDIDREYGYAGNKNSINSRLKRLQDDGLIQKIRTGQYKGKYRKLS